MSQKDRKKLSRNEKCPCDNGKKYKNCHGRLRENTLQSLKKVTAKEIEEVKALEIQRKIQQGLGKPIISTKFDDLREVNVGDKMYKGKWKTQQFPGLLISEG